MPMATPTLTSSRVFESRAMLCLHRSFSLMGMPQALVAKIRVLGTFLNDQSVIFAVVCVIATASVPQIQEELDCQELFGGQLFLPLDFLSQERGQSVTYIFE